MNKWVSNERILLQGLKTDSRDLVVNSKGIFLVGRSKADKKTGAVGGEPVIARQQGSCDCLHSNTRLNLPK